MPFLSNLLRAGLGAGARRLGGVAAGAGLRAGAAAGSAGRAAWGGLSYGAGGLGSGLYRMSNMSNAGMWATTGAIGGGVYGAFADDTSVLGGALMGAGLFAGGYGAGRLGARGIRGYSLARRYNLGRGQAAGVGMRAMGRMSQRFMGSMYNRAVNGFQGMAGNAAARFGPLAF